ncbi:hypothetical protein QBC34DRAFT_292829 [Podospora aff. communis PSN243]|uniref:DUF7892 domain-containing protein n=1 Tax=Podospora aff. communis PSN243 TaxID=3040156 RepID=A0AAV9GYU3_9PEZI|nr:hypothetical protein QBC34DRAFT_292829 [Podospora aff. communis PSN243]
MDRNLPAGDLSTTVADTGTTEGSPLSVSRKRKTYGDDTDPDDAPDSGENAKKVKLANRDGKQPSYPSVRGDRSLLPCEIWHHIFTFCPPKSLGQLLRVNKLFNRYLDPSSDQDAPVSEKHSALAPLKPNAIWRASRRLFWPQMPTPLRSKSELEMWRLACSPSCQYCNKRDDQSRSNAQPPRPGPGVNGVSAIWPLAIRACAPCLLRETMKELDLLVSPDIPSATLEALPFACLTRDLHVLSSAMVEQGLPADVQITKLFLRDDVQQLKQEFATVRDMGSGTVDEWLKGLGGRGKDARLQATKWEKWEAAGGVTKMLSQLWPGRSESSGKPSSASTTAAASPTLVPTLPPNPSLPPVPPVPLSQLRQERTPEEVARLKAARKAEIERRALLLDPPLTADVLRHMTSFQAATQIITTLDDNAWELLKPRLEAQRAEGEAREQEISSHAKAADERVERHRRLETTLATTKEARDLIDKDWEEIQAPLRARIATYADEIIRDGWDNGKKVSKDTCPKFAAEVLIYIRKRFYAEIAKDAAAVKAAGQTPPRDPPEGPFTQKLTLENMKWIFDTKIKPHTERYRKELFYCNGCEGNLKAFGFEGVIQHYAAKHTTVLSQGSIIVHWRAEWPEHPPFSPEARAHKPTPFHPQVSTPFGVDSGPPPAGYGFPFMSGPPAPPTYPPHPGFGPAPFPDPYHQGPSQPYQPPAPFHGHAPPPGPPGYGPPQQYPPPTSYPPYQPPPGPYPNGAVDPATAYNPPPAPPVYSPGYAPFPASAPPPPGYHAPGPPVPPAYPDSYQARLEEVARNSREIWQTLGNIKDLPGSARVFVTLHHVVKRFRSRFYETPPLSLFNDGLSDNKDMRPVRNINGLICKACHLGLGNGPVEEDRKSFSLPQLTKHFQTKHLDPMQAYNAPPLDWVVDMVLLTDQASISNLRSYLNEYQRSLLVDALPDLFQRHSAGGHHSQPVAPANQGAGAEGHTPHVGGYVPLHGQIPQPRSVGDPGSATRTPESYKPYEQFPLPPKPDAGSYQPHRHDQPDHANPVSGFFVEPDYPGGREANGESTGADSPGNGRQSPQGRRRDNNQLRRKNSGRSKRDRGRPQGQNGPGRSRFRDGHERDADEGRHDSRRDDGRAMWTTDSTGPDRSSSASGRAGPGDYQGGPPLQHYAPPNGSRGAPLRSEPAPQIPQEEPNLLSALEMHLDQRRTPMAEPGRTSQPQFVDSRNVNVAAGTRNPPRSAAYYDVNGDRSRSPEQGYRPTYPRPGPPARNDAQYQDHRASLEGPPRRFEETRYDGPRDSRGPEPFPDHHRYAEDTRREPRPTVQAYEIVHVIDETGQYFIRRPIQHMPESRYASEIRRDGGEGYVPTPAPQEAVYVGAARQTRAAEARDVRGEDLPYYEEYDPRFPNA